MNWYYLVGETQRGPVNDEQFRRLRVEGEVTAATSVWHEGMAQWALLQEVPAETEKPDLHKPALRAADSSAAADSPELTTAPSSPQGDTLACMNCGRAMKLAEAEDIGGLRVCPDCKPIVLGRVRTAINTEDPEPVGLTLEELLQREEPIDRWRCLREGWNLMRRDPHGLRTVVCGESLMVPVAALVPSILMVLSPPYVQPVFALIVFVLAALLYAGLNSAILRGLRGEKMTLNMLGVGFGPPRVDLILAALATAAAWLAYSFFSNSLLFNLLPQPSISQPGKPTVSEPWVPAILVIYALFTIGVIAFLKILWSLATLLIIDKDYPFWDAMKASRKLILKHFFSICPTIVLIGAIHLSGLLLCVLGIVFTAPLGEAMSMALYQQIAGPLKSRRTLN